jgi:hypothetical protein
LRENASWRRKYIFPANNPLATVAENVSHSVLSCCHHSIFLTPNWDIHPAQFLIYSYQIVVLSIAICLAPKRCQLQTINTFNHDNLPPWLNHRCNSIGLYSLQTYLSRDGLSKVMLRSHNEGVKVLTLYQKDRPFHIGSEMTDTEQCTKWVQTQHDDKLWSKGNQEKNWIQEADEPLSTQIGKNSKTLLWSLKSH